MSRYVCYEERLDPNHSVYMVLIKHWRSGGQRGSAGRGSCNSTTTVREGGREERERVRDEERGTERRACEREMGEGREEGGEKERKEREKQRQERGERGHKGRVRERVK